MKMRMEYQETAVPLCSHRKIVCFVQQSRSGLAQLTANAAALAMLMLCCNATPSSGSVPDTKAIMCCILRAILVTRSNKQTLFLPSRVVTQQNTYSRMHGMPT